MLPQFEKIMECFPGMVAIPDNSSKDRDVPNYYHLFYERRRLLHSVSNLVATVNSRQYVSGNPYGLRGRIEISDDFDRVVPKKKRSELLNAINSIDF